MSQPGSFKSIPLTARTEDGVVGVGGVGVGGEGGGMQMEGGGGGGGEGVGVDKVSESKKRALYQNFKSEKAKAKAQNKKQDTLHIDVEDATEKARQKDEAKRESMHERILSHRRIEGFKELMAAKERFEFERRLVQRAEVRRFMCQVFLDMTALEDERKNEKGFFAEMSDYVTCNLGPYSVEPPVRASRTSHTSRTSRSKSSSHHGKKSEHDADCAKHGLHSESVEAVLLKSSQDPVQVQVQSDAPVQDTSCVMS